MVRFDDLLKLTAYAFLGFLIFLLLSVNLGWNWFFLSWVQLIPFEDKALHFILMGGLSFFVNILFAAKRRRIGNQSILLGTALVLFLTTIHRLAEAKVWTLSP